jgi:uncharacterized protein YukE
MSEASNLIALSGALTNTATKYAQVSVEIRTGLIVLGSTAEELKTTWAGASQEAFMGAWERAIRDGAKVSNTLNSAQAAMTSLAATIDANLAPIQNLHYYHLYEGDSEALRRAQHTAQIARDNILTAAISVQEKLVQLQSGLGTCSTGDEKLPEDLEREILEVKILNQLLDDAERNPPPPSPPPGCLSFNWGDWLRSLLSMLGAGLIVEADDVARNRVGKVEPWIFWSRAAIIAAATGPHMHKFFDECGPIKNKNLSSLLLAIWGGSAAITYQNTLIPSGKWVYHDIFGEKEVEEQKKREDQYQEEVKEEGVPPIA